MSAAGAEDHKLTVVLLNWQRPDNVRRFVIQYAGMACVAEVIVFDNAPFRPGQNPPPLLPPGVQKLRYVRSYTDAGLVSRFAAAALARTELVLFADDDIELPTKTVDRLLAEHLRNTAGVVGIYGRRLNKDGVYSTKTVYGPCEVVLTRACVTTRRDACAAVDATHRMVKAIPGGVPYGNGEDIVLSYVARTRTRQPNLAFALDHSNIGYADRHSISVRFAGHERHRTSVLRWCQNTLPYTT